MATYQLFIDDERYSVTTLRLLAMIDERGARNTAEKAMLESSHHLGVELYRDDRRVFGMGSLGGRMLGRFAVRTSTRFQRQAGK